MADQPKLERLEVEPEVLRFLDQQRLLGESHSDVLRRLLGLAGRDRTTELQTFMRTSEFMAKSNLTERYLSLLAFLRQQDPRRFDQSVLSIRRGQRVYLSRSRLAIEVSGKSTQPRNIPESNLWVLTNMRADRKIQLVREILNALGYEPMTMTWVRRFLRRGLSVRAARKTRG